MNKLVHDFDKKKSLFDFEFPLFQQIQNLRLPLMCFAIEKQEDYEMKKKI